jgi:hypothetical protein
VVFNCPGVGFHIYWFDSVRVLRSADIARKDRIMKKLDSVRVSREILADIPEYSGQKIISFFRFGLPLSIDKNKCV